MDDTVCIESLTVGDLSLVDDQSRSPHLEIPVANVELHIDFFQLCKQQPTELLVTDYNENCDQPLEISPLSVRMTSLPHVRLQGLWERFV